MNYIQLEESTQKVNQDQIQQLDSKIKNSLNQLRKMRENLEKKQEAPKQWYLNKG